MENEMSRLKSQLKAAESANAKWQVSLIFACVQVRYGHLHDFMREIKSRGERVKTIVNTRLSILCLQVYDAQRNEQFQTLQKRLTETEGRLAASSGTPSFSEQQQQDIDRLLMQSKQKVDEAEQEKMKVIKY